LTLDLKTITPPTLFQLEGGEVPCTGLSSSYGVPLSDDFVHGFSVLLLSPFLGGHTVLSCFLGDSFLLFVGGNGSLMILESKKKSCLHTIFFSLNRLILKKKKTFENIAQVRKCYSVYYLFLLKVFGDCPYWLDYT
jgi:hypothetical protein